MFGFKFLAAKLSKPFSIYINFDGHSSISSQDSPFFLSRGRKSFEWPCILKKTFQVPDCGKVKAGGCGLTDNCDTKTQTCVDTKDAPGFLCVGTSIKSVFIQKTN